MYGTIRGMATYPDGNPGEYPVDLTTDTGRFRMYAADLNGTKYVPDYPGFRNFEKISDAEIEALLAEHTSVYLALAAFFGSLASDASLHTGIFKDYDLSVDLKTLADDLRKQSAFWTNKAAEENVLGGTADIFDSFTLGSTARYGRPELSPPVV